MKVYVIKTKGEKDFETKKTNQISTLFLLPPPCSSITVLITHTCDEQPRRILQTNQGRDAREDWLEMTQDYNLNILKTRQVQLT